MQAENDESICMCITKTSKMHGPTQSACFIFFHKIYRDFLNYSSTIALEKVAHSGYQPNPKVGICDKDSHVKERVVAPKAKSLF